MKITIGRHGRLSCFFNACLKIPQRLLSAGFLYLFACLLFKLKLYEEVNLMKALNGKKNHIAINREVFIYELQERKGCSSA
jgi:hypothetical protein